MHAYSNLFNPSHVCTRLQLCTTYKYIIDSDLSFAKRVLYDKPVVHRSLPLNLSRPFKVLVFSDPHVDFEYRVVSVLASVEQEQEVRHAAVLQN